MDFTVIILAGGESRRMGSLKALALYRGRELIRYPIDLARSLSGRILIAGSNPELERFGIPTLRDHYEVRAALTGIHAGLRASRTDWNLVLTCDMPLVSRGLIEKMVVLLNDRVKIVVPRHQERTEPLCGFYHRSLLPVIESNVESGMMSPLALLPLVPHQFLTLEDVQEPDAALIFKNINSKTDLGEV